MYPANSVANETITEGTQQYLSNDPAVAKLMIVSALAILTGCIQIIFAILHLGFVTKYLSDSIVKGFICGSAYHVVVSQINALLGIRLERTEIPFALIAV